MAGARPHRVHRGGVRRPWPGRWGCTWGLSRRLPRQPVLCHRCHRVDEKGGLPPGRGWTGGTCGWPSWTWPGDVRGVFDTWLGRMAGRLETIPPFWHILGPLAEMERSGQARALESVMAFVHATGTAPDASTLAGHTAGSSPPAGRGRTGHVAAIEAEDAVSPPPRRAGGRRRPPGGGRRPHTVRVRPGVVRGRRGVVLCAVSGRATRWWC